jgi:EmrB/QacA subfamily drug resistance transporter
MAFLQRPCETQTEARRDPKRTSRASTWVLLVAIAGSSMAFIDANAVNVALPSIQRDLRASAGALQWVVEGYSLFLSALILIGGSLGDIFGRRRIFVTGVAIFTCASLASAAAQSILELDVARAIQGIGGALATPGSLSLISANFSGAERGRAIGTWSGFAAITAALGPLLGGWLTQTASWRFIFLINLPLAIFIVVASALRVPESRDESADRSVDVVGASLATLGLGALTFGLIRLQEQASDVAGIASAAGGLVLLVAFLAWERRAPEPMVQLGVFRNVTFSGANAYTFLLYAALGGSLFFVPFDLQNVQGYSPAAAGAAMLPFIIIMFAMSRWSGGLVASIGARIPLVAGAIVAGFGFLAYARAGIGGSYWTTFFPAAAVLGFGGALFVAPLTTTVMGAVSPDHAGIASGINNALARVAGLLAIAALGIVLSATFYGDFDRRIGALHVSPGTSAILAHDRGALATGKPLVSMNAPDRARVNALLASSYTAGFANVMIVSAALSFVAALIAGWTIRAAPIVRT